MPALEGNLNSAALQEVLDTLVEKNPAATLLISDGRNEKVIYFSTGGIRLYASEGRRIARLEEHLVRKGFVPPDGMAVALEAASSGRREGLDEVLERKGLLPRARFLEAIGDLLHQELCDVVVWEGAIFEFYEGNPPPEIFDQDHPALFASLDVKAIAARVKEWCQEWSVLKGKLYSERIRPRLLPSGSQVAEAKEAAPALRHVYRLIDGQRSLRDISRAGNLSFPEAARLVRDGLRDGHLRATLVPEKEPATGEEVMGEIERLEEALDRAINTILIHKRIAIGYEKIQEPDRASEHYQSIGNLHAEAGRVASALESYRRAMTLSPQNISAHECLIRRLQEGGQDDRARVEMVDLARKLLGFGLAERALETLRAMKSKAAGFFDVRLLFADILAILQRIPEAVAEYLGVAREKKRTGALEGIEDIYRKVLALDPGNKEARAGLFQERSRQVGKGLLWFHRASGIAALLGILLWGGNELWARFTWMEKGKEVEALLAGGRAREGLERLWEAGKGHPGSLLAGSLLAREKGLFESAFWRLEDDLGRAERLRAEGRLSDSREVFQLVQASGLLPGQVDRARRGTREVEVARREGMELRRNAELFLDARFYEDSFLNCRKILDRFPELAANLQMPLFIRTDPPGAEVKVNGVRWGSAPIWITITLGTAAEVRMEKPGFVPQSVQGLSDRRSPFISVTLRREG